MTIIYALILLSLALGVLGLIAFFWSMRNGQFEDMSGNAERILFDDDRPLPKKESKAASCKGTSSCCCD